ncbi:hypothetical protein MJ390_29475 [Klebsiella pneumoniae]|nr:hypothetical protein MJ390_29475 [Klebsiella pneumoniae]
MLPKAHPLSLGMLGMHGARSTNFILQEADLLIVLGARFDDRAIGKTESSSARTRRLSTSISTAPNWAKLSNRTCGDSGRCGGSLSPAEPAD